MLSGLFAMGLAGAVFGAEADFRNLMTAAEAASGKGEFDAALQNFNTAFQTADKPELKAEAVYARNAFLLKNKKYADAEKLLKEFSQDESLPPLVRRKALVTLGGQIMWGRPEDAKQCLDQALTIPTTDVNDQVQTSSSMGYIYLIMKQPENALEAWLPVMDMDPREVHPANHSAIAHQIGLIYQQMKNVENARKYFQLAVEYGKKVKYAFDYSASEKALKELK